MKFNRSAFLLFVIAAFVGIAAIVPTDIFGQTTRKKTTSRRKPNPVPTIPIGSAEIISQAGQEVETLPLVETPTEKPLAAPDDPSAEKIKELRARVKNLESSRPNEYDEKQKRLLLNLDILTRAEQRSESLRRQIFEMVEKETTVRTRLDQIEYDIRPEVVQRSSVTFTGSMRPEELREMREKGLKAEKLNLQSLLTQIQNNKTDLEANLLKSEALVEKLRTKLEKDIDESLKDPEENR